MALRFLNASYSVLSYAVRRSAGISAAAPLPPAISIELTSICNLHCPECVTGTGLISRGNSFLDYALARKIADELGGFVLSAWLSFQGEPMLHPDFFRIADLFSHMNPVIATNGHYLDSERCIGLADSPLKKIIISYDGVSASTYGMYRRGGNHELVTEGIRRLAATIRERRSGLKIVLQFLLHRGNEHEARAAVAFARSVGAGFRVKSMQVLDPVRAGEWVSSDDLRSRYVRGDDGSWQRAGSPGRGCMRMWSSAVITSDGDVVPCCFDKHAVHRMGNLNSQSFAEIWSSERYMDFRATVMKSRETVDICRDCPQGTRLLFRR
jgi:radical SAM protein with 4Fe4S-binding SPASM domain